MQGGVELVEKSLKDTINLEKCHKIAPVIKCKGNHIKY